MLLSSECAQASVPPPRVNTLPLALCQHLPSPRTEAHQDEQRYKRGQVSTLPTVEKEQGGAVKVPRRHSLCLHAQRATVCKGGLCAALASLCTHSGALYSFTCPSTAHGRDI